MFGFITLSTSSSRAAAAWTLCRPHWFFTVFKVLNKHECIRCDMMQNIAPTWKIGSNDYLCVLISEALSGTLPLLADGNTPCCVLHRWPSPRGLSSRASCWASSMRRPIWPRSSWSPGMTPTETTPSTCRRATGWAASEPSGTPDTTGEQGQHLGPGEVEPGLILFELHMSSGSNKGTWLDSLEAPSFTWRVEIRISLNVNTEIWSSICLKPGNVVFTSKLMFSTEKKKLVSIWISSLFVGVHR